MRSCCSSKFKCAPLGSKQSQSHFSMKILSSLERCLLRRVGLLLFLAASQCAQLAAATQCLQCASTGGKVKLEGWTEVKNSWPIKDKDYFVATEKGHHLIEVRNLPKKLDHDLLVRLEYYYSFAKVKPVLQMTPCDTNVFLQSKDDQSKKWLEHEQRISRDKCALRNELAFNVLLHDPGDIFAWRLMSIEPLVGEEPKKDEGSDRKPDSTSEKPLNGGEEDLSEHIDQEATTPAAKTSEPTGVPTDQAETTRPPTPGSTVPTSSAPEDSGALGDSGRRSGESEGDNPSRQEATTQPSEATEKIDEAGSRLPSSGGATTLSPTDPLALKEVTPRPWGQAAAITDSSTGTTIRYGFRGTDRPPTTRPGLKEVPSSGSVDEIEDLLNGELGRASTESPTRSLSIENENSEADGNKVDDGEENASIGEQTKSELLKRDEAKSEAEQSRFADLSKPKARPKRFASTGESGAGQKSHVGGAICRPSSCDRSFFHMARFTALINGVPQLDGELLEMTDRKFYLSTKDKPLSVKLELSDEDLYERDACFQTHLYMDKGTELELYLDRSPRNSKAGEGGENEKTWQRLLERVVRKPSDSTAAKWERFSRCLCDYMPAYEPSSPDDSQVRLLIKPLKTGPGKQIGLVADSKKSFFTRKIYPVHSFAPDVVRLNNERAFDLYWALDHDGLQKARAAILPNYVDSADNKSQKVYQPQLVISDIDPTQDYFDITSRWMQIKDIELIEQPIQFGYSALENDWVERIEFQFQRAGDPLDRWISQVAYKAGSNASRKSEGAAEVGSRPVRRTTMDVPIRLRGLDSDHFRVRLRHKLKRPDAQSSNRVVEQASAKSLVVNSLSFADACSYGRRNFCQNDGQCVPTGPATAECRCKPGFSGPLCSVVRPCEVRYLDRNITGYELCKSIGARCVDSLPVFRCAWPNDKFYRCDALTSEPGVMTGYQTHETPSISEGKLESVSPDEQMSKLQEVVNQQARLIIILGVFMIAIVVFALVLGGGMISRLNKSNCKLRKSQGEVHELARRFSPGTSSAPFAAAARNQTGPARQSAGSISKAPGVASYNNNAFDLE